MNKTILVIVRFPEYFAPRFRFASPHRSDLLRPMIPICFAPPLN